MTDSTTIFIGYPEQNDFTDGWFYRISEKETDETLNVHWNKTRVGALNKRRSTIRHWTANHTCIIDNGDTSYTTLKIDPVYKAP